METQTLSFVVAPLRAPSTPFKRALPWLVSGAVAISVVLGLVLEGRPWICDCGEVRLWVSSAWSGHTSQHLFDPYTFAHVEHGLIFFVLLYFLAPKMSWAWRFALTMGVEGVWELVENSQWMIERYQAVTASYDYTGDAIINSLGDFIAAGVGFVVASTIGWRWTIALFIATELSLAYFIHDTLILNAIMLLTPSKLIEHWQLRARS